MQNRFGLKDAILLAGVIVAIVLALLGMIQKDMLKKDLEALRGNLAERTRLVARLNARLENAGTSPAATPPVGQRTSATHSVDESWARPGVPVSVRDDHRISDSHPLPRTRTTWTLRG